jgi:hypothetical protein
MINAVALTLTQLLTQESYLLKTVKIDLSHPSRREDVRPALSLYFYDIRESLEKKCDSNQEGKTYSTVNSKNSLYWFDLSFIVIAWDWTKLGEQNLLSETLTLLIQHRLIREEKLASELKGYGALPMIVNRSIPDINNFWQALDLPLKPAIYLTVKTPFKILR